MIDRRSLVAGGALAALAGCGSKFRTYGGPEVTRVQVYKDRRRMYLIHHTSVLEDYKVHLGFTAEGPKQFEGDGKTPEGTYIIDRRNPNSLFHLSLGISYPTREQVEFAEAQGKSAGGNIFIHGARNPTSPRGPDWTAGCIAVRDRQMEDVYAMVRNGTPIDIFP